MFSPLVASHFICYFLAFSAGTVLPDVIADCFTPDVNSGDIFMSKKKMNSLFSFVNYILACLVFYH